MVDFFFLRFFVFVFGMVDAHTKNSTVCSKKQKTSTAPGPGRPGPGFTYGPCRFQLARPFPTFPAVTSRRSQAATIRRIPVATSLRHPRLPPAVANSDWSISVRWLRLWFPAATSSSPPLPLPFAFSPFPSIRPQRDQSPLPPPPAPAAGSRPPPYPALQWSHLWRKTVRVSKSALNYFSLVWGLSCN